MNKKRKLGILFFVIIFISIYFAIVQFCGVSYLEGIVLFLVAVLFTCFCILATYLTFTDEDHSDSPDKL